jgi:NDP-sugar pyrophosphorylase family protein
MLLKYNTTVIMLVGGAGSRMQPLSSDVTKSMIVFMGKPLLEITINMFKSQGFNNFIFSSMGKNGEIYKHFEDGKKLEIAIKYHGEKCFQGSASCVKHIIDEFNEEISDPFFVVYGDSLLKSSFLNILEYHNHNSSLCTILYHQPNFESFLYKYHDNKFEIKGERTNYGVMNISENERITYFEEKPLLTDIPKRFNNPVANAAVYVLDKKILSYIQPDTACDFGNDLFPKMVKSGIECIGYDIKTGYRLDIGTLESFYTSHLAIIEGILDYDFIYEEHIRGIWIGKKTKIDQSSLIIKPAYIGAKSTIGPNTVIDHRIIGNNVLIGKSSRIIKCIILDNATIGDGVEIAESIIGEYSKVSDDIHLPSGVVLGNYCQIGNKQLRLPDSKFIGLINKNLL